jgi:hypothetical protein
MTDAPSGPRYAYAPGHPVFRVPPPKTPIWRYTPLTKLVCLLESRQLHLCRASKFTDEFEGSVTEQTDADLTEFERLVRASPEESGFLRAERANAREDVAISCWHKATHETIGMWKIYGTNDECVAIRSTVGRLITSLPQQQDPSRMDLESTYIGEVEYIDYATGAIPFFNALDPYVFKQREYHQEQEVRAVALITEDATRDSACGTTTDFAVIETGLLLPINVGALIEGVVVSPKASAAFERSVRAHLDRCDLRSTPVLKSSLGGTPIY